MQHNCPFCRCAVKIKFPFNYKKNCHHLKGSELASRRATREEFISKYYRKLKVGELAELMIDCGMYSPRSYRKDVIGFVRCAIERVKKKGK